MGKVLRIGYTQTAYTSRRNFLGATGNRYVSLRPFNYLTASFWYHKLTKRPAVNAYKGSAIGHAFYDVAHFFNTIPFDQHPWVATGGGPLPWFEKELQEFLFAGEDIHAVKNIRLLEKGIRACASSYCKALFVNSYCSLAIEKALVANFPCYEAAILSKLQVLYPPQKLIVHSVAEKQALVAGNDKIVFLYIGHDFYRKGGLAVLRCFERLSREFNNFQVITIGALRNDVPSVFKPDMEADAKRLIDQYNHTWLEHYNTLPNDQVMALMKKADVGLLPTYSDIFGYSVLESQACGCPTITSDVRAMPEINNEACGWVFEVGQKTKHREIANMREVLDSYEMEIKLETVVRSILQDPDFRPHQEARIAACLKRIEQMHSPERHRQILEETYQKAVTH